MIGAGGQVFKKMEVKEDGQMMDVFVMVKPATSSKIGLQMAEAMSRVREAMYSLCSFIILVYQELVTVPGSTRGKSLPDSVHSLLNSWPGSGSNGCEPVRSRYHALTFERMANGLALSRQVMGPGAHGHLCFLCYRFGNGTAYCREHTSKSRAAVMVIKTFRLRRVKTRIDGY